MGSSHSLRNNLSRSLGAKNFSTFWNYWNPIFGYYLGQKVFKPSRRYFLKSVSLLITFCFCGLLHDLVTLLVRGSTSFLFTIWFILMGAGVLITRLLNHDFSEKKWVVRALINASIIICCFILSTCLINLFGTLNSNGVR
ncbi:MBOAT family O-acyltransferase [Persicitalea jodogahamensis]|uniref:MBOAT family O-acyltransferase n=1 Tax=Persicitalea jodogahamensis TaxID=402147 RepID=UPI001679F097